METRPPLATPRPPVAVNGTKIRELRKRRGIEIADFARMVGCSRSHLANIELGRKRAGADTFERICDALQLAPSQRWRIKKATRTPETAAA